MDLFERQWDTYRSVVDNDWMEHREITAACGGALRRWMSEHPDRAGTARLLDLGCGDLALMAPVFRSLPLGGYVGLDITAAVLPLARAELGSVPYEARFVHGDMLSFVTAGDDEFDVVHASLVVHHLGDDDKALLLSALREKVPAGGVFVWADVFRRPGETQADYAQRYADRIRRSWHAIDDDARESIVSHMVIYDFPADRDAIVAVAQRRGWAWQWVWRGRHDAEAVAVLTAV